MNMREEWIEALRAWAVGNDSIAELWLFGSRAKGTAQPNSDIDIALLVGARPRSKGMERKDLLEANAQIFTVQGRALDAVASRNVKVLVVGNPANTNALIAMKSAPSLKPRRSKSSAPEAPGPLRRSRRGPSGRRAWRLRNGLSYLRSPRWIVCSQLCAQ